MNIGELKKMLEQYPEDMEPLVEKWSDYAPVDKVSVIRGVKKDGWVMRSHPTMSAKKQISGKRISTFGMD